MKNVLLVLSFLFGALLQSCQLTPSAIQKTSDDLVAIGGQFQSTLEVLKESNVIHGKTADKLESIAGASQDALRQVTASIVSAPKKADGTIDWGGWAAGGGVTGGLATLLALWGKVKGSQDAHAASAERHDDNEADIAEIQKQLAAMKAAATGKPS